MIRKQRINDTYCVRISLVSAPGWSSLFLFLQGQTIYIEQWKTVHDAYALRNACTSWLR